MELLVLGVLLGAGAARRKEVTKALAKGYMAVAETSAHLREDMRAAIKEAQIEQDREPPYPETSGLDASEEMLALQEEADSGPPAAKAIKPAVKPDSTDQPKPARSLLKSVARGFLEVAEKTRSATAHVREDLRDAVEEARYEREQAASRRAARSVPEETIVPGGKKAIKPKAASTVKTAPPNTPKKAATPAAKPQAQRTTTQKTTAAAPATKAATQQTRPTKAAPPDSGAQPMAAETKAETTQIVP
jgi:hypothetical protein